LSGNLVWEPCLGTLSENCGWNLGGNGFGKSTQRHSALVGRDGAGVSIGSEHPNLWREAPRLNLSELPCERRTHPQQKVRRRSGIDPEPALEANTLISGAKRQGLNFPSFPAGEGSIPRSPQGTHPQRQPRQATGPFDVRLAPFV